MRVIPVIDLKGGNAVHARGGNRARYAPVRSGLIDVPGDAVALAAAYRERLGLDELYVADLDAITGRPPQRSVVRELAVQGGPLYLDAGTTTPQDAERALHDGASRVVVGLETLSSFGSLAMIVAAVGRDRVVFSLDLIDGEPLLAAGARHAGGPLHLARAAVDAGATTLLVLDLARIGSGEGLDLELFVALREALPEVELIAGGGVRGREDLARLHTAGCGGALVATALHEGRIKEEDLVGFG